MRGSVKNARVEGKLEEAIERLMAEYAGSKCLEEYVKENRGLVKGVANAACEIANAATLTAEFRDLDPGRSYFAGYRISRKGISGNLARDWSNSSEAVKGEEAMEERPPPHSGHFKNKCHFNKQ